MNPASLLFPGVWEPLERRMLKALHDYHENRKQWSRNPIAPSGIILSKAMDVKGKCEICGAAVSGYAKRCMTHRSRKLFPIKQNETPV